MTNLKNILITGGAGFIGSKLANRLVEAGHAVRVVDNLSPQIHGSDPGRDSHSFASLPPGAKLIRAEVADIQAHQELVDQADVIFHLAAETGTGQSMYEQSRYVSANIDATAVLMEALAQRPTPLQRLVLTSSRAVYGEGRYQCQQHGLKYPKNRANNRFTEGVFNPLCDECGEPLEAQATHELDPPKPVSVYAISKLCQEQLVEVAASHLNFPLSIFRLQNVYGEGQSLTNPYTGILSIFASRIAQGSGIEVFEDGLESRDFVHVDDVVRALMAVVDDANPGVDVINVGTGEAVSVLDLIEALEQELKTTADFSVTGEVRFGDIRHNFADIARLDSRLGVQPEVNFSSGLRRYLTWFREQALPGSKYEASLSELRSRGLLK